MKIIKRNGNEVEFDKQKIINAIWKANNEMTNDEEKLGSLDITNIARDIEEKLEKDGYAYSVEQIQDLVELGIMRMEKYILAKAYITYRYQHNLNREQTNLDNQILSIVEYENEEIKQENSNKDPGLASTQRDYIADTVSKDITNRILLPKEVAEAHKNGIIYFHDAGYFISHISNCCLINLEDMFKNGTVISGTKIDTPHSFSTACNIATQVIAQIASSQYGKRYLPCLNWINRARGCRKAIFC